jgi:translation initiation factor 2 subunit 3
MATMLNGTAVMDAALLLIAANEPCPQPQTSEHLAGVQIMNLKHLIIIQNKIDLVRSEDAQNQYSSILKCTAATAANKAPIIPVSAQLGYNMDYVIQHIAKIPVPMRDYSAKPRMIVIRSFDVNKAGTDVRELRGGIAGGSILQGCLRIGDEIEIRPGTLERQGDTPVCRIRRTRVIRLKAEDNYLQFAVPGGLIGLETTLDPSLFRNDRLIGQVIGHPNSLPDVFLALTVSVQLFHRLVGVVQTATGGTKVAPLRLREVLLINVGSTPTGGQIVGIQDNFVAIRLKIPVCASNGERIALSRKIENLNWRLIGWGRILKGDPVHIVEP